MNCAIYPILNSSSSNKSVQINWLHYYFTILKLQRQFIKRVNIELCIKLLYSSPSTSVCTNNQSSATFPLFQGTNQGFLLSPLLFALPFTFISCFKKEVRFKRIMRWSGAKAGQFT